MFGGVEIEPGTNEEDEEPSQSGGRPKYRETGRCFLAVIPDRTRETFEREIRARVQPGSLVWTDCHRSYPWLNEGGFNHQSVNHSLEFVGADGQSTNACEGMWSRVKRGLRLANTRKPAENDYGPLLGEFVWRARNIRGRSWRSGAFDNTLALVRAEFGADFQRQLWAEAGFGCANEPSLYQVEATDGPQMADK